MPIAFVTGAGGQDGSYLVELLLAKGYEVHGVIRKFGSFRRPWIDALIRMSEIQGKTFCIHDVDLRDIAAVRSIVIEIRPDEFYHLAAQSHVGKSFELAEATCEFTAMGTLRLLELLRDLPKPPRFLNVGSSEIFGRPDHSPQDEQTPICPVTPYGVAKAFAVQITRVYREVYGLFACNAICYNHESPRRDPSFVSRKITSAVAEIALGSKEKLVLGNIDSVRDWGFAGDYVEGMYRILQNQSADDFVLATGQESSVRDILSIAFGFVGLNWEDHVTLDPNLIRPVDSQNLLGDSSKARDRLKWLPSTTIRKLICDMVRVDMEECHRSKIE